MPLKMHPPLHVHSGPWLGRTYLDHHAKSVTEVGTHLGVSRQSMSTLLKGHSALTATMALRFEKASGISADKTLISLRDKCGPVFGHAHDAVMVEIDEALTPIFELGG